MQGKSQPPKVVPSKSVKIKSIQYLKEQFPVTPIASKHPSDYQSSKTNPSHTDYPAVASRPPVTSSYQHTKTIQTQVAKPLEKPNYPENICLEADLEEINHLIANDLSNQNINQDTTTNLNQPPNTNHLGQGQGQGTLTTLTNCKWRQIQPGTDHAR